MSTEQLPSPFNLTVACPLRRLRTATIALPLALDLVFTGSLPCGVAHSTMPINISISLPPSFAATLSPVISAAPVADNIASEDRNERNSDDSISVASFLPLPSQFNHLQRASWAALYASVQLWLRGGGVDRDSPERTWGNHVFWVAFLGTFPCFPAGNWTSWDSNVSIFDDPFVFEWVQRNASDDSETHAPACNDSCPACISARCELWAEFETYVRLFYPSGPLTSPY